MSDEFGFGPNSPFGEDPNGEDESFDYHDSLEELKARKDHPVTKMVMNMMLSRAIDELQEVTKKFGVIGEVTEDAIVLATHETLHNFQVVIYRTMEQIEKALAAGGSIHVMDTPLGAWIEMVKAYVESQPKVDCDCPKCQAERGMKEWTEHIEIPDGIGDELDDLIQGKEDDQ